MNGDGGRGCVDGKLNGGNGERDWVLLVCDGC